MDLNIVGKFIKEQRIAKGFTQAELADKILVSEKTISKWECGKGFPDTSLILPLCKELDISANELLSGKILSSDEYKQQAEYNLVTLKAQRETSAKFMLTLEYVLGYMTSICFFILIYVASYIPMATWLKIFLIVFGFIKFIFGIHFCLLIEKDAGFYECKHCNNKYIPSYNQILWSMHYGRIRYMQCPRCGKKSWQKKVIK